MRLDQKETGLDVLDDLADLLRAALNRGRAPLVPVQQEIDWLKRYVNIEQRRFADRMQVTWSIAPGCEQIPVPPLLLQPLVENAVRHAVGVDPIAGRLTISAQCQADRLHVSVRDDGPGPPPDWDADQCGGIGIRNIRRRLATLYEGEADLQFERLVPRGFAAHLSLPCAPPQTTFGETQP